MTSDLSVKLHDANQVKQTSPPGTGKKKVASTMMKSRNTKHSMQNNTTHTLEQKKIRQNPQESFSNIWLDKLKH